MITQSGRKTTITQMEKQTDLMISTVRSYVEAMGGKLSLMVEFLDREPVSLEDFEDTEDLPSRRV